MSDNRSYCGPLDLSKVAGGEPYEMRYLVDEMAHEFPSHSRKQVEQAAKESVAVKQFHSSRPMIENSIRLKLRNSQYGQVSPVVRGIARSLRPRWMFLARFAALHMTPSVSRAYSTPVCPPGDDFAVAR